ncbi:hypothetical protein [Sporocytophaga myxococcoides]|uniref:hypothetical protein n=1 Tax=Sporocytophaga myxococcoides TaxID=153721 RepID=UPI0004196485|nr:hypothetical protein [Sporocytophaga myxococcoides]
MESDAKRHDKLGDLKRSLNDKCVSAVHDAVCNLLLFTEVIANSNDNVVVAFGDDHSVRLKS